MCTPPRGPPYGGRLRDYTTTLYREWQKNKDPINTLLIRFWGAPQEQHDRSHRRESVHHQSPRSCASPERYGHRLQPIAERLEAGIMNYVAPP